MSIINLEGKWRLRAEFLDLGPERFNEVLNRPEGEFNIIDFGPNKFPVKEGWIDALVPCDVITPLVENNIIEEPLDKTNTIDSYGLKDLSWWFYKEFTISDEDYENEKIFLNFDVLDFKADIIVNGIPIGSHSNTFSAFRSEIKRYLKKGDNYILVRLCHGLEDFLEKDSISFYSGSKFAVQDRRVYTRKPQFTFGWDWCKPVPTCGIGRNAYVEALSGAVVDGAYIYTHKIEEDKAILHLETTIDNLREYTSDDAKLYIDIKYEDELVFTKETDLHINGGLTYWDDVIEIDNPKLWWPNGMGDQNLYTVSIAVECRGVRNDYKPFKMGIRTIELIQDRINEEERLFAFEVNGIKIFAKGGNWVPADSVYLRVTDEKYEALISEAAEANFNMLRMWGGGLYEPDVFYEKCSEYGIMIMHDFMYSCAFYPDQLDWFKWEAAKEADFQTKRLRNHACMAVWTGNNEIHESITDWFHDELALDYFHGVTVFNYIQPSAVRRNSKAIPYQPSSPFGGGISNAQEIGDSHIWRWVGRDEETKLKFRYELEGFDRLYTKFMSEYGFHGPLKKSSIERFHAGEEIEYLSDIWTHHGEDAGKREGIGQAIDRHLVDFDGMGMDDYLLYGGLMQGLLYKELSESLRFKDYCYGDLIWMYNDCWPETGWTIIDYYLTRKISFYFLKRSFANNMFIMRQDGDKIGVVAINERPHEVSLDLEYGYVSFDGTKELSESKKVTLAPFTREEILSIDVKEDLSKGLYFVRDKNENSNFLPGMSIRSYYRDFKFPEAKLEILDSKKEAGKTLVTIKAENYVPFVYLDLEDDVKLSDNYFSMLPGETRIIEIEEEIDGEIIVKTPKATYKDERLMDEPFSH